ncbi:MAG: hypothetical protein OSA78_08645 [Flavobacteriales bacterium]|nr:hypothetical protein [Flavobacteriales bacterium]
MKPFFKRIGLFTLALVGVWLLLFIASLQSYIIEYTIFASEKNAGYTNQRSTEWNENELHEEDVLFFGSSTCYSGIDPSALEAFGLSGFNFCSSSQELGNSAALIPAALTDASPESIVLDVYPNMWGAVTPALESTKDWIINSNLRTPPWSKAYRTLALESGDLFTLVTTFYYAFVRKFKAAGSNPDIPKDLKGDYRGLGFVGRSFDALDSIECESLTRSMSDTECSYLIEISTHCAERSIQLILINPPQLCEEIFDMPTCFDTLAYIDGNEWPGAKTPSNFYDDHHLVEAGALSYSAWLAQQIASLLHAP